MKQCSSQTTTCRREPARLRGGKGFHKQIQSVWHATAEGHIRSEKAITKSDGRKGRIDVHVQADEEMVAVVEIKKSNWDRMTLTALRRNVRRYIRQIWEYIESELEAGHDVCPGIVFPKRPKRSDRLRLIEELFEAEGIPCVWEDETVKERKQRSEANRAVGATAEARRVRSS